MVKDGLGTVLDGSWRPLGASWGSKMRQESGFGAKKNILGVDPSAGGGSREGRGRVGGAQSARQRPPGEGIRGGGQWPKANIPDLTRHGPMARRIIFIGVLCVTGHVLKPS